MKWLTRFLFILLFYPVFAGAFADVVWDVATETLAVPKLVEETVVLGKELDNLIQQVAYTKQELERLDSNNWNTAQSTITQLGNQINQSNTLAYSAGNIDSNFRKVFPGYQTNTGTSYTDQYHNIVDTTQNTLNSILQAMGSSAADFENENSRMQLLQTQSQNAVGQTQAIQAASQIASTQVEQLQLIRQTMIAQTNAQTAYYAAQTQKEANSTKAIDTMLKDSSHDITNNTLNSDPINDPFVK